MNSKVTNNITNINTFMLLKKTEYIENKANELEGVLDDIKSKFLALEQSTSVSNITNTNSSEPSETAESLILSYITTSSLEVELDTLCRAINACTTEELVVDKRAILSIKNKATKITTIDNPNITKLIIPCQKVAMNNHIYIKTIFYMHCTTLDKLFYNNKTLQELDISGIDFSARSYSVNDMFTGCISLKKLTALGSTIYTITREGSGLSIDPTIQINTDTIYEATIEWSGGVGTIVSVTAI